MDTNIEYQKSVENWILTQNNVIDTMELNVYYLENEVRLKQEALDLNKKALLHEKKFLANYLKQQENGI